MLKSENMEAWKRDLLIDVRRNYSPYAYISEVSGNRITLGIQIQEVVPDKGENGPSLKFIPINDIANFELTRSNKMKKFSRRHFLKQVQVKYLAMIDGSQRALLPSMYTKLVRIPEVSISMNPMMKILRILEDRGMVFLDEMTKKKSPVEKVKLYFNVLEDLDFVATEENYFVPGKQMRKYQANEIEPPELFEIILGEVIQRRSKYLHEVLNWTMMVPYLRWSNSYYLPAYETRRIVELDQKDFIDNYRRFYQLSHDYTRYISQIGRILDVKALFKRGSCYEGDKEILDQYLKEADKEPVLAPIRVASA